MARVLTSKGSGPIVMLGGVAVREQVTMQVALDGDRAPAVVLRFAVREGVPECVGVEVTSGPGARRIHSVDLAALDLDSLAVQAFQRHLVGEMRGPREYALTVDSFDRGRRSIASAVHRGGQSDALLREVARVYLAATEKPTQGVRAVLGGVSRETAVRAVREARKRGWVPPHPATAEQAAEARQRLAEADRAAAAADARIAAEPPRPMGRAEALEALGGKFADVARREAAEQEEDR